MKKILTNDYEVNWFHAILIYTFLIFFFSVNSYSEGTTTNSEGDQSPAIHSENGEVNINYYGISAKEFEEVAIELGVTKTALNNFFRILNQKQATGKDIDRRLRKIAEQYKELQKKLELSKDEKLFISTLKIKGQKLLEMGDFERAEELISFINTDLTTKAWHAFNKKNYKEAIKWAEQCIEEFEPSAIREQKNLGKNNVPLPPIGKVKSENERTEIFHRGLLNDVATCWYVKGRSLEKLEKTGEAIKAYQRAEIYTYGRTWDPSWEGFWSPSEVSRDRRIFLRNGWENGNEIIEWIKENKQWIFIVSLTLSIILWKWNIEWIKENKQWIFSGIGVFILSLIISWIID